MKISPHWLRDFVSYKADVRQLAADLTQAGISVESISGEGENALFEMDITTNRPDAMNHYGVARECSAIYDLELKPIPIKLPKAGKTKAAFKIDIEVPQLCPRFTARVLHDVKIVPSPSRIANRLELMGSRPINNAVDATNYVLFEMGKPTHVFDLDLLEGGKLMIRRARKGETLKTLDGVDRRLSEEDVVVADAKRAVGLAGVMGGWDTMITEKTRNILIESAWWDPTSVRRTARRHGLHTDASHRFERGADFESTVPSTGRVAQVILESGGGELIGGEIDVVARRLKRPAVKLRHSELKRILGIDIKDPELLRILKRLGFAASRKGTAFNVSLPSWRLDVEREIDVVEEVARIYGYNQFPNTLPGFSGAVVELPHAPKDARVRSTLLASGYNEAVSLTFVSAAEAQQFSTVKPVELENPLSEEAQVMRTSLVPGMLEMLEHNLNRGIRDVRLFETGNVFEMEGERSREHRQLSIGGTGSVTEAGVHGESRPYSFFDLKGAVEAVLESFEHSTLYYDAHVGAGYYHPGRSARAVLDGATIARFGQLHPEIAAARKLKQDVFIAEIALDRLYQQPLRQPCYRPASRFPAVERDFSFVFDGGTSFESIRSAVEQLAIPELEGFAPVEILRGNEKQGAAVPAGKFSILLRATFQSAERTLRDEDVAVWSGRIIEALKALGGALRASLSTEDNGRIERDT
jgi:phenylalanyl-tRNA synthetase beta chain